MSEILQINIENCNSFLIFNHKHFNAQDHERRVREAIQLSHKELVSQVGRDMAPYLKTIVGPWLVARGDPYGPAASAASAAFTEAFSAHKQKDVLLFCKKDIMKVSHNLCISCIYLQIHCKSISVLALAQCMGCTCTHSFNINWQSFMLQV